VEKDKTVTLKKSAKVSVAPMMDWTDRHCRYFHRKISKKVLLYTEMLTASAIVNGNTIKLLNYNECEHPIAIQLGGSEPNLLAKAVKIVERWNYDEVNLNIGCPSDRVKSGCFGAVLMRSPELVSDCVKAMLDASERAEITIKCRIGVDEDNPEIVLPEFIEKMHLAGVKRLSIHARKAWLQGISPKQNRSLPPLEYDLIYKMKKIFPDLHISINGGVQTYDEIKIHLEHGMDGVMIGRAAYHNPMQVLGKIDAEIFNHDYNINSFEVIDEMLPYIERHIQDGGKLNHITRHMLGIFSGQPGAKIWRQEMSKHAHKMDSSPNILVDAYKRVLMLQKEIENTSHYKQGIKY